MMKISVSNKIFQEKMRVVLCAPIKKISNETDTVKVRELLTVEIKVKQ